MGPKNNYCISDYMSDITASKFLYVKYESVEITNKMQPCNRIYYSVY